MKKLVSSTLVIVFSLIFLACGQTRNTRNTSPEEGATVESNFSNSGDGGISEAEVAESLEYLSSDELQGRKTGTNGIEMAAQYIEKVFKDSNIKPYFQSYRDSFEINGVTGYNIIGFKEGKDPELKNEFIILGAHYDHIGEGKLVGKDSLANGANDNASGTTAVLELAKYFSENETRRSILFTLYSAEEMGLVGSKHLAERLKREGLDLYVMFNIEMVGIPMTNRDYTAYITGFELSNLAEKFNKYAGNTVVGYLPEAQEYQLFRRSDNYPFYQEFNVPAQTISTFDFTNYDYYHHVSDEYEKMNVPFMVKLIEDIIPGITEMVNSKTREIKMK